MPLGLPSTARVFVINDGFDNLELSVRLPPDSARLPVTVSFPEGKLIGLAKERLPVDISCCSSRPLSFTTAVDLMDEDGRAFSLMVTGATDNCSLSHGSFMQVRLAFRGGEGGTDSLWHQTKPDISIQTLGPTSTCCWDDVCVLATWLSACLRLIRNTMGITSNSKVGKDGPGCGASNRQLVQWQFGAYITAH